MILYKKYITEFLLLALAFLIPVYENFVPITIIFLSALWLMDGGFKNKFRNLIKNKTGFIFFGFYILYVIGMLYTSDFSRGIFDLEVKLSLFVFPMIFFSGTEIIRNFNPDKIMKSFVAGCFTISLFLSVRALSIYSHTKEIGSLCYENLSFQMHPSYLAMYLNFALIVIFFDFFDGKKLKILFAVRLFLFLFFIAFIIMLSSKAGILCFLINALFMMVYLLYKKKYITVLVAAVISILMVILLADIAKVAGTRIKTAFDVFVNYKSISNLSDESTSDRILIWRASANVIRENPVLGVGTGDVRDELQNEYKRGNIPFIFEKKLNSHNQYFQTGVAIGITGLIILILSLAVPFYLAVKNRSWIYVFFLLLMIINFLFESMLERQAGVVFYAFFNALLYSWNLLLKNDNACEA